MVAKEPVGSSMTSRHGNGYEVTSCAKGSLRTAMTQKSVTSATGKYQTSLSTQAYVLCSRKDYELVKKVGVWIFCM